MPCFAGTGATDARDDKSPSLRLLAYRVGAKRRGNLLFITLVRDLTVRSRARSHEEATYRGRYPSVSRWAQAARSK